MRFWPRLAAVVAGHGHVVYLLADAVVDVPAQSISANLKEHGTAVTRFGLVTLLLPAVWPLAGQSLVQVPDRTKFDVIFDGTQGDRLKCDVKSMEPWVDFGFRFVLRYSADCEIRQFGGGAADLKAYLRVRREDSTQMVFGDEFLIPAAPKGFDLTKLKRVHSQLMLSGAIGAGMGAYNMDLLLVDNHNRVCRKHWLAKAFPHGREREIDFSLRPNTLAELTPIPIPSTRGNSQSGPLTVLSMRHHSTQRRANCELGSRFFA